MNRHQSEIINCSLAQQSTLSEKWASTCSRASFSGSSHEGLFKYVVYKQPLSLDRFYIHDVANAEGAGNLKFDYQIG